MQTFLSIFYSLYQNVVYQTLRWPVFNILLITDIYKYVWTPIYWLLAATNRSIDGVDDYLKFMNYGFVTVKKEDKEMLKHVGDLLINHSIK